MTMMISVVNKTSGKPESYWNTQEDADKHITRFGMKEDFTTQPAPRPKTRKTYTGPERRGI